MSTRYITLAVTVCLCMSPTETMCDASPAELNRSNQDLQIVAHQFPHLLLNAFMALNHDNDKDERYQAFQNAVNNIVNIASVIRAAHEMTGDEIDDMLYSIDTLIDDQAYMPTHGHHDSRTTIDTAEIYEYDELPMTRNAHIIAHNFPHLVLNTYIALNNENDRTERHLALYNAVNNIVNIASVIRSSQYVNRENVYKILNILDTALGEDNIELRFCNDESH